jgi:hypothetical protein
VDDDHARHIAAGRSDGMTAIREYGFRSRRHAAIGDDER